MTECHISTTCSMHTAVLTLQSYPHICCAEAPAFSPGLLKAKDMLKRLEAQMWLVSVPPMLPPFLPSRACRPLCKCLLCVKSLQYKMLNGHKCSITGHLTSPSLIYQDMAFYNLEFNVWHELQVNTCLCRTFNAGSVQRTVLSPTCIPVDFSYFIHLFLHVMLA